MGLGTHDDDGVNWSLDLKLVNVDLGPYGSGLHKIVIRDGVIDVVEPLAERVRSVESGGIDLMGCTVLPGIDDSHLHAFYFGRALISVDFQEADRTPVVSPPVMRLATYCPFANAWQIPLG